MNTLYYHKNFSTRCWLVLRSFSSLYNWVFKCAIHSFICNQIRFSRCRTCFSFTGELSIKVEISAKSSPNRKIPPSAWESSNKFQMNQQQRLLISQKAITWEKIWLLHLDFVKLQPKFQSYPKYLNFSLQWYKPKQSFQVIELQF